MSDPYVYAMLNLIAANVVGDRWPRIAFNVVALGWFYLAFKDLFTSGGAV